MRVLATTLALLLSLGARALTIPQGRIYFDNSRTGYSHVCFVYGSDSRAETYVLAMTQDGGKWKVEIPAEASDMYRFTFVGGSVREGLHTRNFSAFKDSISHVAGLNRTATSDAQMQPGDIFVPASGDNWAQGSWMSLALWEATQGTSGVSQISGTLPVVYVNTQDRQSVNDTETQIPAGVYIDPLSSGYEALGTAEAPVSATIKGRGNYTWRDFDKKPYKLKFDVKQKVLGLPNNRHWCLMAGADDNLGFLRNPAGHIISKAVALRWTPRMRPVEFVLNGRYMGLYFLTEHVRIAGHRVDIREQADNETHPDSVTGGWLVEIDNYPSEGNITFREGNGQDVMVSLREPEVLAQAQRTYLEKQIYGLNEALYGSSEAKVEQMIDMQEAAKYYLVQEIMEDCESYHGSCFLYKDRDSLGTADRWKFGPVWDFGNAYNRHQETWIYDRPIWPQYWIGQLATWPAFQKEVKEQWWVFYHTQKDSVRAQISGMASQIAQAAKNDASVWRNTKGYNDNSDIATKLNDFLRLYDWRIQWLYSQWGEGTRPAAWGTEQIPANTHSTKVLRNGRIFILRDGKVYDLTGNRVK